MDLSLLQAKVTQFRDARDWRQFHTPKNLAQAIAVEAGELNDLYLWDRRPCLFDVRDEMADILIYLLSLADVADLDLGEAVLAKIKKNELKYPVEKAKGNAEKPRND
jgi:dCTP diphosphatase